MSSRRSKPEVRFRLRITKGDVTKDEVLDMMAGGAEMQALMADVGGMTT